MCGSNQQMSQQHYGGRASGATVTGSSTGWRSIEGADIITVLT